MRQTLQKEQCLGQPRKVCTEAHMYFCGSIRSQRAGRNSLPSMRPPSIDALRLAGKAIVHGLGPGNVAIAGDNGVGVAPFECFLRKQRSVNAAVDHPRAPAAGDATHLIPAQSIAGMNADADDVAGVDRFRNDRLERLIDQESGRRPWRE